ncbi:MAG: hypothetical protein ABL888_13390 [Pirellulaceae bacterium]
MKPFAILIILAALCSIMVNPLWLDAQDGKKGKTKRRPEPSERPVRTEVITPIRNETFNKNGSARERRQGGEPRSVGDVLVITGATDGDRQVDPQIAVGGDHVLHATNHGLIIYDKQGNWVQGVSQDAFNGGIDPKLFFDPHNRIFGFDLWNPWDKEKQKPVNISISETANPTGAWNTYPVPAPNGVDGGGIGYSRRWVGYSFPGGDEQTFVVRSADLKSGKPATIFHFSGNLGQPVANQDADDDLYFFQLTNEEFVIRKITDAGDGTPKYSVVSRAKHNLKYVGWPPQSPQKDGEKPTASGDRNPKNLVKQGEHLWFSHTVNCEGRAAVQWHQLKLDCSVVQSGRISSPTASFIQTTIVVNKNLDVLVGFQQTSETMYISPRMAVRLASDPPGELRAITCIGEGLAATKGGPWGDYSGSVVDGDNLLDLWTVQSIADVQGNGDAIIAKYPIRN